MYFKHFRTIICMLVLSSYFHSYSIVNFQETDSHALAPEMNLDNIMM